MHMKVIISQTAAVDADNKLHMKAVTRVIASKDGWVG